MEEYLTVKDVAKMLLVTELTVQRWVRLGRLRPIRICRVLRFERKDLIRQLEKYRYGGEPGHDATMG